MSVDVKGKSLEVILLDMFQLLSEVHTCLFTMHLQGTQGEEIKDKIARLEAHLNMASAFLLQ